MVTRFFFDVEGTDQQGYCPCYNHNGCLPAVKNEGKGNGIGLRNLIKKNETLWNQNMIGASTPR